MRKIAVIACAAVLTLGSAFAAFANTGTGSKIDGPAVLELSYTDATLAGMDVLHDEFAYDANNTVFKGWWSANLMNTTNTAWAGMTISAGVGYNVALVKGIGLEDEWGYSADSVKSFRPAGTPVYNTYLGSKTYENGAVGQLYKSVYFNFIDPVTTGQKVKFLVYTDNSYYVPEGGSSQPSFSLTLTPMATPEPGGLVALLSGGVALVGMRRRRK